MEEKQQLVAAYKAMYSAMIDKDIGALGALLSEDFVLVHMTGMRQSREEFLRSLTNGTLNYYSAVHERTYAEVNGKAATLVGESLVSAAVFGGGRHTWRLQLRLQFKRQAYGWRIACVTAATY